MKTSIVVALITVASFLIGCESNINEPVGSPQVPQPATKTLDITGLVARMNESGQKEFVEVSGRVKYSVTKQLADEVAGNPQVYYVVISADFELKNNGFPETITWKAVGSSTDRFTIAENCTQCLTKSFLIQKMAGESSLTIEFEIMNDNLSAGRMWITQNLVP